jgi:hypothetical protein
MSNKILFFLLFTGICITPALYGSNPASRIITEPEKQKMMRECQEKKQSLHRVVDQLKERMTFLSFGKPFEGRKQKRSRAPYPRTFN